ncbi:AMP-binding protein [Serratia quinivorans]|uniref:AMP-binding protein n=1 Tax=Serratia quinivorans TaxID=137545 RepID=UPI0034C66DDF
MMCFDWSQSDNARFIDAFDNAVEDNPHAIALRFNEHEISYQELQAMAWCYARQFEKIIVDDVAGMVIHLPRSIELLAAILACQYIDLPYIPVDIRTARNKVERILQASRYVLVYDGRATENGFEEAVDVADFGTLPNENVAFERMEHKNPESYRIYTSGSTGEPKAVRVSHVGCSNLISYFSHLLSADNTMSWLSATSISFDIFYLEYTVPLANGGTVILLDEQQLRSAQDIARRVVAYSPTVFQSTPSMFKCLMPYLPATWKFNKTLVGGEKLGRQLAEELHSRSGWLCNVYGPTETTVWSTAHVIRHPGDNRIGRPIAKTTVKILDAQLREVATREEGRIFIGGAGVSLGYLNNPELTQERFISLAKQDSGELFYDTGDIGFVDDEGVMNYLYRDGDFYKVNGYRIDCAEIIDALEDIAGVDEAAVAVVEGVEGSATLVAWFKKRDQQLDGFAIRRHLEQQLSHYMIPGYFFDTDVLPYSISGKLDKKALISMSEERIKAKNHSSTSIDETEKEPAVEVIHPAMVLLGNYINTDNMNSDDNFFHFGLSSMQAISYHLELLELYPALELHDLFDRPTIKLLLEPCAEVMS